MKVFIPFLAVVQSGASYNLSTVLDNLNDIQEWAVDLTARRSENVPDGLKEFQEEFVNTAKYGATKKDVRALEQRGRRVILDDMGTYGKNGMDMRRLSGYGCYGTPLDSRSAEWVGKGKPVDLIDEVNYRLTNCYKCLKIDMPGEQCDGRQPYRIGTRTGILTCRNDVGSCKRKTCECDKAYVEELTGIVETYDPAFHIDNGFDREERCRMRAPRGRANHDDDEDKTKHETKCCGEGLSRLVFKIDRFECCTDGSVKPIGQC